MKNTRKNTTPIQVTLASLARNYIENMISYQVLVHESYNRRLGPTGESHSKVDCARTIQSFENLTIYKMTGSTRRFAWSWSRPLECIGRLYNAF